MSLFCNYMIHEGKIALINFKKDQLNSSRRKVFSELLSIRNKSIVNKRGNRVGNNGVSSKGLTAYINKKYSTISFNALITINQYYENGEITLEEKNNLEKKEKAKHSLSLRTIQRDLTYLEKKGWIEESNKKYFVSETFIKKMRFSPFDLDEEFLVTIMKLHMPLYNTIENNLKELITLFGTYVIACLLEVSRPIDDLFFTARKLKPLTFEEKNEFTEKWLENVIDTKLMYMYFLQTFLNQPGDKIVKHLKKLNLKGFKSNVPIYADKNGKEYDHLKVITDNQIVYIDQNNKIYNPETIDSLRKLKKVPSNILPLTFFKTMSLSHGKKYYYELDKKRFMKVHKTFDKLNPEISKQLKSNMAWSVRGGIKPLKIYDHWDSPM